MSKNQVTPLQVEINQAFSFSLPGKLISPELAHTKFDAIATWRGKVWDITFYPTDPDEPIELPANLEETARDLAEKKVEVLLSKAGYQLPNITPTKICLNTLDTGSAEPPTPEVVLGQLIEDPYQTARIDENPTYHLQFQDGVLYQLWAGNEERWRKGEAKQISPWSEWRIIPGQEQL